MEFILRETYSLQVLSLFHKLFLLTSLITITYGHSTSSHVSDNYLYEVTTVTTLVLSYPKCGAYRQHSERLFTMITFLNSISRIAYLFFMTDGSSVARISGNSILWNTACLIETKRRNPSSPFLCEGQIIVERLFVYKQ